MPPAMAAVGLGALALLVAVPAYCERITGRPIDVTWLFTVNLVIVYALQVAPLFVYAAFASRPLRRFPACAARTRFVCFVPAHNEERVLQVSVGSLLAQRYPRELFEVWVVSDGSTDGTEDIAASLGARVVSTTTRGVGKARALACAFQRTLRGPDDDRYVCVVDADNRVDADFLAEMNNAICAGGFRCLQAFQDVVNGPANWITKGLWITTLASSRFYNVGRSEGIGNALIFGTGWCCQAGLLHRYWPRIQTQTEDIELNGLLLLHEGIGVPCVPGARIYDEKPTNLWVAIRQRHRWMTGHMRTAGVLFWPCLLAGLRRRDVRLVELALYYLLPFVMNLGNLQVLLSTGLQARLLAVHGPAASPIVQACVLGLTLLYLFGYQVIGFALETRLWGRAPLYSVMAAISGFITWTPALVWACFTISRTDWMFHTPHTGSPEPSAPAVTRVRGVLARGWGRGLAPAPLLRVTAAAIALLALLPVAGLGSEVPTGGLGAAPAMAPVTAAPPMEAPFGHVTRAKEGPTLVRASEAILAGRAARAITLLEPFVAADSHNMEAEGLLAAALYVSDRRVQAEWQAAVLRRQDPSGRQTAFAVARDLLPAFANRLPMADQLVDLLTPTGGTDGYAWLGQLFAERGRYDDASTILACGAAALDDTSDPSSASLLSALGYNAWKAGLPATAVTAYWQAIRLRPRSWELYLDLGRAYYAWGQYEAASAAWTTAGRLRHGDHRATP
jgi:hypothetical protein